ncbi:hypothetical protein PAPYR_12507 [Paratrimastix pyriformis]|uniref:RING-type domain-containing protein n=1 Tax=Paratrimastix pyriformis TaxID=342808 RepID=A0ABQ8U737_9EUKA|nr:hypothetical protein PAPYR_12507 [Paratrimastix pyriformis]
MSNPLMSSWAGLRAELDRLRAQAYDPRARALEEHERAVRAAVTKVGRAVEAIEGDLTCSLCMRPMEEPRTLMPCAHTFCKRCLESHRDPATGGYACIECGPGKLPTGIYPNKALDAVLGKWIFQKQSLQELKEATSNAGTIATTPRVSPRTSPRT